MKVFTLTLLTTLALSITLPAVQAEDRSVGEVRGTGLWGQMACGMCVGAGMAVALSGWSGLIAVLSGSPEVADACTGACTN